jgi:tetratricopeptide (TPR) repeat protein
MKKISQFTGLLLFVIIISNCEKTVYYHDRTDPVFTYQPNFTKITDQSVALYWSTDEASNAKLSHSFYENMENPDTVLLPEFREENILEISGLWPNIKYFFVVEIFDYEGNGPVFSDTLQARTLTNDFSNVWNQISNNNFNEARDLIQNSDEQSIRMSFTAAWIELRLGNIDAALERMELLYQDFPEFLPNLAGLVVINNALQNYNNVISYGNMLLNEDNFWVFPYTGADLNYKFVRLMMAEAYINLGFTDYAQNQLDSIFPGNQLNAERPETWRVDGVLYDNYKAAMIALIDYLYRIF